MTLLHRFRVWFDRAFRIYSECCVCHKVTRGVKWPWGIASHTFCPECELKQAKEVDDYEKSKRIRDSIR